MIIEFNGIAGCGKTTLSNEVFQTLKLIHKEVIKLGVDEFRQDSYKVFNLLSILHPRNWSFITFLIGNIRAFVASNIYESLIQLSYSVYLHQNYIKSIKKNSIVISDEGIIQCVASIATKLNLPTRDIDKLLSCFDDCIGDVFSVNCNILSEACLHRRNLRNRKNSYIDYLSSEEQLNYLERFFDNVMLIRKKKIFDSRSIDVDMLGDAHMLSDMIIDRFKCKTNN